MKNSCVIIAIIWAFHCSLSAGVVRLSFLNSEEAVRDTLDILTSSECSKQASSIFQRVVNHYYTTGFDFDFQKFPKQKDGFYTFATMQEVVAALPHRLPDTQHPYEINCIDTMILLVADQMKIDLLPDENFGPFMVEMPPTNSDAVAIALTATARDAFSKEYPAWYRENTKDLFSDSIQPKRISLTAAFFAGTSYPWLPTTRMLKTES
jgi:hypothetical protein